MNAFFKIVSLLGPYLTMEMLIAIERRRVPWFYKLSPVVRDAICAVLTLWLLFGWYIAIILLLTSMVTTSRKGQ